MTNLALAARSCLPFVRSRTLASVVINSSARIEAVIRWLESVTLERAVIRKLRVTGVHVASALSARSVTQQRLAHLLWLLPAIRGLSLFEWTSIQTQASLKLALGRLTSLESFTFHAKLDTPAHFTALTILPTPHLLQRLELKMPRFGSHGGVAIPLTITPRELFVSVPLFDRADSLFKHSTFVGLATRLVVLDVDPRYLSTNMLNAVASTLRAVAFNSFNGNVKDEVFDVNLPHLEVVVLSVHRPPKPCITGIPLLRYVTTLAFCHTPQAPDAMQRFVEGHQHLRRLVLSEYRPYGSPEVGLNSTPAMSALRAAVPQIDVATIRSSLWLDPAALLDTGRFVSRSRW